jgi:hypothetical protein
LIALILHTPLFLRTDGLAEHLPAVAHLRAEIDRYAALKAKGWVTQRRYLPIVFSD